MAKFPFVTDAENGDVPVNFFPVQDSNQQVVLLYTPGLKSLCTLPSCSIIRSLLSWGDYLYAVAVRGSQSVLWKISAGGSFTEIGYWTSTNTGHCWMANNASQLVVVDGAFSGVYKGAAGGFAEIIDVDFPGAATCSYQDGYGLFTWPGTNQWFFSSINDFTQYDSGDRYQKMAQPDGLTSVHSHLREPWLFGPRTTEVWYNAGGDNSSESNPTFARNPGGVIPMGIGAAASSVGDQHGVPMTWLSSYKTVVSASGYTPTEINNQMLSRVIRDMPGFDDAIAYGYKDGGHTFYVITFPQGNVTWVFDFSTKMWHKRSSWQTEGGYGRHRGNCYASLGNKHYVGDYENGKVYEMSMDYYDDDDTLMQRTIHSQEQISSIKRQFYPDIQVDLVNAGDPVNSAWYSAPWFERPTISLYISSDGGHTWSSEIQRSTGAAGEFGFRSIWRRLGSGYRRMYKVEVSDRVPWKVGGLIW